MDKAQLALVAHIDSFKDQTTPNLKTVDVYRGQVKDVVKLRNQSPSAYVMFMGGKPAAVEESYEMDILTVVDSQIYDRQDNTNLSLAGSLARLLKANLNFKDSEEKNWFFLPENIEAEMVVQDPKYSIIALHIVLYRS